MDVLEFSLFLSDYHLAAAAGFWTSIAVITAALSFWRITAAVGSRPSHKSNAPLQDPTPNLKTTPAPPPPAAEEFTPAVCSCDDGVLRKGKFTLYYGVEEGGGDDGVISVCEMYEYYDDIDRIRLPVVRTMDLGWYRSQDLTVLNGSVVRLWK